MQAPPRPSDALLPVAIGLCARVAVALWAGPRFAPVEDGRFYHELAQRLAEGKGYTWQWPDGVVTFVAHYPVGYPALVSLAYRVFGSAPVTAMLLNALLGALGVAAVHRVSTESAGRFGALLAALAVALHPALVLYTPALMTEGVTGALLAIAAGIVALARSRSGRARFGFIVLLGCVLGVGTLIRGQTLVLAPLFGALALGSDATARSARARLVAAVLTSAVALSIVAPWTARNCQKMDQCVVVSANLGWNLLIGATPGATGTFVPISGDSVPPECRTVFGEAAKDACFARAALRQIAERPRAWLALVPAKLARTFEYCGAAGWYLNASNPRAFGDRDKLRLGVAETAWQRVLMALALYAMARADGPRRRARRVVAVLGCLSLLGPIGWLAHPALVGGALCLGSALVRHGPLALAAAAVGTTALTHAAFFGAGRYSLAVFALTAALAGTAWSRRRAAGPAKPAF